MHAGTLRALEFDRIVAVVAGPRRHAHRAAIGWHSSIHSTDAAAVIAAQRATTRGHAVPRGLSRAFRCARRPTSKRSSTRSTSTDARSSRCGCSGSPTTSSRSSSRAHAVQKLVGVSDPERARRRRRVVQGRDRRRAAQDRSVRRRRRQRQPGAGQHPRAAAPTESEAAHARSSRFVRGTRHVEVPAGSGRHRPQRPLRPDGARRASRSRFPGIVHGGSASGASLLLEPLETVEINNDIVALEEQEAEEVRRILLALTDNFRGRPDDLRARSTSRPSST